jgi:tetratricopeptide (TPR) repeat protein
MKKLLLAAVLLGMAVVMLSSTAAAQSPAACGCYCGKVLRPPCSDNACKQACGWRDPSPGGNTTQPTYDYEAERQRQAEIERQRLEAEAERQRQEAERQRQQIEEQKRREEEEAKRKQEFERKKQEALGSMKDIAEGEFGLKNTGGSGPGLKDQGDTGGLKDAPRDVPPNCKWGDQGSSVVDLRCLGLDQDKPIVIDPHVVRGQERVFPAQIDPATFKNANYNKGFDALMRLTFSVKDAMDAVAYFKAAQLQRPNDPMVRNGLLLAQDILKGRQQKEQEDKAKAVQNVYQSMATLLTGDVNTAYDIAQRATKLDPKNQDIWNWSLTTAALKYNYKGVLPPAQTTAEKLVGNALLCEAFGDYATEIKQLEAAKRLTPDDKTVAVMLEHARHLAAKKPVLATTTPAPK